MNIVLKNSLKNVFGKPFRTLLVVFAIFMCCLCALLSFEFGGSITRVFTEYLGSVSRADIMVTSGGSDLNNLPEGFPEADTLPVVTNCEMLYKDIDGEYCYVTTDYLNIFGIDIDNAVDMEFISHMDIGYGEIYISQDFSDDFGYEVGDKIIVHDRADDEVELTIGGIFPEETKNPILTGNCGIVNMETSDDLSCGYRDCDTLFIDVKDDALIEDAKDLIKGTFPDASTTDLFLSGSAMDILNEIRAVFYLMFAVTFLLVIFVTASICNRIVSERMSFIGTLRSLGMSVQGTTRILLLENVLYALLGSVPAVVLYGLVRTPLLKALFTTASGEDIPIAAISAPLLIWVVVGAVLVECMIPLRAILKALKTSIRDIIFDNRDTEYKFSRFTFVMGLICLALAVLTFIFRSSFVCAILCLVTTVSALAFLFPRLLKLVTSGIKKFADKNNKPAWSLAAVEAISRKATVGNGVLCATASAMCIVVYALAVGMSSSLSGIAYDSDVVIDCSKSAKYYSYIDYIDGVSDVEYLYYSMQDYVLNDQDKATYGMVYGAPAGGFTYYHGFDIPETFEEGTILVEKSYAEKNDLSVGDEITITINPEGVFPIIRDYTIGAIIENNQYNEGLTSIVITEEEYKAIFRDTPGELLVKCDDPEAVSDALETYGKGTYSTVKTNQELIEEQENNNKTSKVIITVIIVIALGMTAIGMISNQLIGFEGRKKECAVMLSTAMGRGKLSSVLLLEAFITAFTASGVGTIIGTFLTTVFKAASADSAIPVMTLEIDPLKNIIFFVLLTLVFTGTVLFPIKNLKKMKISEQIKYE